MRFLSSKRTIALLVMLNYIVFIPRLIRQDLPQGFYLTVALLLWITYFNKTTDEEYPF